ncbi:uncharacterized protein LOC121428455 isoform X2 [Lytechinus variegatus]|uniref:uncharacterized protein LOC121428455 isoform X2 n=1 Tax=Lytechinus variegatus TaxID=7654 RepID=UPI001BB1D9C2|nr:uncharacterized protein LOC121428455 isoform X2 [Lytechinus variegatus]
MLTKGKERLVYVGKNLIKLESEVKLLREKLAAAQTTLGEMGHQMDLQKTRTRQLLAGWKLKLEESEDKIMSQAHEKDSQFTDLISDLMYFEGCLKRERQEIVSKLGDKDRRIRELERQVMKQEKQINALNKANEKLISSLHDTRGMSMSEDDRSNGAKSSDDSHHDESSSSHDNSSETERVSSPSPMMSSRRPNGRRCTVHTGPTSQQVSGIRHLNNNTIKAGSPTNGHQHRVRFVDDVVNDLSASRPRKGFLMKTEDRSKARKISLPAYRLPVPNEGDENIRFF